MAARLTKLFLLLLAVSQVAATCGGQGTEVGNPTSSQPTSGGETPSTPSTQSYQNTDFRVAAEFDTAWSATEQAAPAADTGGSCSVDCGAASPASQGEIDISAAPSTLFTDGKSSVTLYYLALASPRNDLKIYLNTIFHDRTFLPFANSFISGLTYDNPETGTTGGDRQEYYFLYNHSTLLYVVTDLFEANDGVTRFETFIASLRFE